MFLDYWESSMTEIGNSTEPERGRFAPLFFYGVMAGVGLLLSQFAFSRAVRRQIWERDGGVCQESGSTEHLFCAHYDHSRDNPDYNSPDNGRLLSGDRHWLDHYYRVGENGLNPAQNLWALRTMWGGMTDKEKRLVVDEIGDKVYDIL